MLLEAAAAGVAIVATDVGGTGEIFPPQCEAACLVPPDDVQAMSAAIDGLLRTALCAGDWPATPGNASKRRLISRTVDAILTHYEELAG